MAALHVLGSIEGWYNVADAADRPRGQIKVSVTPLKQLDAPHATAALEFGAAPLQLTGPGQQQQQLSATRPQPSSDATSTCADTASANAAAELRAPRAAATAAAAGEGQLQDGLALWGSAGATVLDDEQGLSGDADQLLATLRANLEELDAISAALSQRVKASSPERFCVGQSQQPPNSSRRLQQQLLLRVHMPSGTCSPFLMMRSSLWLLVVSVRVTLTLRSSWVKWIGAWLRIRMMSGNQGQQDPPGLPLHLRSVLPPQQQQQQGWVLPAVVGRCLP
ncbi:hypothetical protein OEZ85_004329 [Tetradesmus obliquus]|uniref:Uncharacterized protein n=1 Tax=Tetradesmus obliquus TaxID=3088 RepID=A0ABY8UKH9_TETOB|nr:hypothetical protein OEZ85_004329 [Tetradesmus obliquus]